MHLVVIDSHTLHHSYPIPIRRWLTSYCRLGPDEFIWKGFMNSWSIIGEAHNIKCRTLVINGTNEGVDHEESVRIWRSELPDHEYFKFTASTHFSHFEERDLCINKIGKFLQAER